MKGVAMCDRERIMEVKKGCYSKSTNKIMEKLFSIRIGSPQFRIRETSDPNAKHYYYYTQEMLLNDLDGSVISENRNTMRQIGTVDNVITVKSGDIVMNLMTGTASCVSGIHDGFLLTKNFCILDPIETVDPLYLVYLINEDQTVKRSLQKSMNEGVVRFITTKQLDELEYPQLPPLETQRIIGNLYFNQKKLSALQIQNAQLIERLIIEQLRRYHDDRK